MRHFLIFLITLYQRFISPCKGFRCAYGCYHGGRSCSGRVKAILAEHGVMAGWPLIQSQFRECREAADMLSSQGRDRRRRRPGRRQPNQRCDGVDNACDCLPDLPCDFGLRDLVRGRFSRLPGARKAGAPDSPAEIPGGDGPR